MTKRKREVWAVVKVSGEAQYAIHGIYASASDAQAEATRLCLWLCNGGAHIESFDVVEASKS